MRPGLGHHDAGGIAPAEVFGFAGLGSAANLPLEIASLAGCPFAYQGLVHWDRYRTLTADPGVATAVIGERSTGGRCCAGRTPPCTPPRPPAAE